MTDERFQDDELEFDDEFVLEDVELDADEFLDEPENADAPATPPRSVPGREQLAPTLNPDHAEEAIPQIAASEEEDDENFADLDPPAFGLADPGLPPEPSDASFEDVLGFAQEPADEAGEGDPQTWSVEVEPHAEWQTDADFVGESLETTVGGEPEEGTDPFGWGRDEAEAAPTASAFEGPEQALFDAAGAVGSDETRFEESGHWHGSAAAFEEIVGEVEHAPRPAAWDTREDDSDFDVDDLDALEAVEIERLDADDFAAEMGPDGYDEPESLVEFMESASEHQPVFGEDVEQAGFDADDDDLSLEPMPSISLDDFDLEDGDAGVAFDEAAEGFAAAAIEHEVADEAGAARDDWDLTLRADGSPMAAPEDEASQDWGEETFVVEDPAEAMAEPEPAAGFGGGRFEQPFAANPMTGAMAVPQGEGWESVELGVGAGDEGDETWEVSEEAPEEVDPEAYDEDDPIYGEEAMAASATVGVEESWSQQDAESDWSELEENYVDGEQEPELHVIGGPGSQRRGGGRLLAAAAVLLIGLGGAAGTIGWLHPEWLGLEPGGPAGVERIAVTRPELSLELARPELELRVADHAEAADGTESLPDSGGEPDVRGNTEIPGGSGQDLVAVTGPGGFDAGDAGGTSTGGVVEPGETPDVVDRGTGGDQLVVESTRPEFTPIEIGESLEMRGPSAEFAPTDLDSVRIGMRAWAQLTNEAVFVGTVRRIEASFVTLKMDAGEITLDREEIVAMVPISDAEDDPVEIENGFVRLGESGTLFGRILRNNGGEHVILETTDSRVSLPLESIDSVGIRTDAGIVVVDDDDDWLEARARRRLSGVESRQENRRNARGAESGDPTRTRSTLPILPAVPPSGGR